MIEVHIPANLFYPELPGGSNQYFRYGPFLRDREVCLHVHTVRKPHHEEAEVDVKGIHIRRYDVPSEIGMLGELEFVTERAIEAIHQKGRPSCLNPLGTTRASISSVSRLWKARLQGIPSCFHFMTVEERRSQSLPGRLKEIVRFQALFSPYRKLLMCSHVMGRVFMDTTGISSRRINVIPNGIDLSVFMPVDEARKRTLREQLQLPPDGPIIGFVGSVVPRKGVDILIEAWKRILSLRPSARLVIVGSLGPRPTVRDVSTLNENERFVEKVRTQVEALSDPGSVIFAGETSLVQEYYQAFDLFAFASHREGLPSVILESMACATPCVVAPFIGLPADGEEYGVAGEHYVKTTHDPRKMADDIVRLIDNSESRETMGQKACDWIRKTQEMGIAADRLAAVYHEMMA